MGKLDLSDEEKQRRSDRMRQLHAEGRAGGQFGKLGGRPRKKRASEVIAEKVANDANLIWANLRELALESEHEKIRMDTSFKLLEIEERERKVVVEEEVKYDQLRHNQLAELVIGNLFELIRDGSIDLGEIIDAEDFTEGEALGLGQGDDGLEEETEEEGAAD